MWGSCRLPCFAESPRDAKPSMRTAWLLRHDTSSPWHAGRKLNRLPSPRLTVMPLGNNLGRS